MNKYNLLPDVASKNCWMSGKQCRTGWDAALCGVSSGSALFTQACLPEYLRQIRIPTSEYFGSLLSHRAHSDQTAWMLISQGTFSHLRHVFIHIFAANTGFCETFFYLVTHTVTVDRIRIKVFVDGETNVFDETVSRTVGFAADRVRLSETGTIKKVSMLFVWKLKNKDLCCRLTSDFILLVSYF